MVANTTGDFPKIMVKETGKSPKEAGACAIPTPIAAASPTTVVERAVKGSCVINLIPVMAMVENTVMVAPPSTHCGIVVSSAENLGQSPQAKINSPVVANTLLATTLLEITIPTF